MNSDLGNLTMLNPPKLEEKRCPNCNAANAPASRECQNCGIIFQKVKSSPPGVLAAQQGMRPHPAAAGQQPSPTTSTTILKLSFQITIVSLFLISLYYIYITQIESRIQAGTFQARLNDFCNLEISNSPSNYVAKGVEPFLTGRVLVVSPRQEVTLYNTSNGVPYTMVQPAEIHPTWFMLSKKLRAKDPSGIDTLIRIHKIIGKAGRYGTMRSKVFSTHKIVLDVYDWKNKTYIGTKVFDPGEGSTFMTDEDYEAMVASASDKTIAAYIQAMDIHE